MRKLTSARLNFKNLIVIGASLVLPALGHAHSDSVQMYAYGFDSITKYSCVPRDINASGQIVGYCYKDNLGIILRAFITLPDRSGMRDLGVVGGKGAEATGINDDGVVVGRSDSGKNRYRAFITDSGGVNLRALDDSRAYLAAGINNAGQVVGVYSDHLGKR